MKVSAFIDTLNSKIDSNAVEADQLNWINKLEQTLYRSHLMEMSTVSFDTVAEEDTYSLMGAPCKFEDIEKLVVCGTEYEKRIDYSEMRSNTYYKKGTDFVLIPAPLTAITDGITIYYVRKPTLKTSANKTTEDLTLTADFGDEFIDLYEYYCHRMACISNREFNDANMFADLYAEALDNFWKWYVDHIPNDVAGMRKIGWR